MNTDENQVKALLMNITFPGAPDSRLIWKKGILKRDGGTLSSFKEATAILTKDFFLYIFDWNMPIVKA